MKSGSRAKRPCSGVWIASGLLLLPIPAAWLTGWLHPRRPDWAAILAEPARPEIARFTPVEAREKHPDALWIDARDAAAYSAGHVPGAIPLREADWENGFSSLIDRWDGRRTLIVYCGGAACDTSVAVALRLRRELDFPDVFVLAGGWEAWLSAGLPVEGAP